MSDLITLDTALAQIPNAPASDQALISSMITAASGVIETDCARTFAQGTYDERHHGTGTQFLYVNNPPIQNVLGVRTGQLPAIYILLTDNTNTVQTATVDVTATGITLTYLYAGTPVINIFPFTSYPTFGSLSAAINALPPLPVGVWSSTQPPQFAQWQTSDLTADLGSWSARNLTVSLNVYWYSLAYFRYAAERGEIWCPAGFVNGYENYRVQYVGGYAVIPQEIQQACAELVQLTYATLRANPLMSNQTIDKYSYTRAANASYNLLSVTSKKAIQQYKLYRVARWQ